jgi:hypothetical protein
MTGHDEFDAEVSTLVRAAFDPIDPAPPRFVPASHRRRVSRRVALVGAAALVVGVPAAAVGVHRALVEQAFTDMGVAGVGGAPPPSHLILESTVSPRVTVRLYQAGAPARTDSGKVGRCVFAETVVGGAVNGGKGYCFTPSADAPPVLSAAQFAVVQLPAGDDPSTVTASRTEGYHFRTGSKDGYAVLAPLTPGPVSLTYTVRGVPKRVVVQVP